jgi:hypothetical protein
MLHPLRVPILPGLIAILIGVAAVMVGSSITGPSNLVAAALSMFVLYFAPAGAMGLLWPGPSWGWGLWIAIPLVLTILLSVIFSGQLGAFVQHDLGPVVAAVAGGLAGGVIGSLSRAKFCR